MMAVEFEAARPADYLTRLAGSDFGRAYKSLVIDELEIEPGNAVADLGCGPGTDLPAFADATGPGGSVLGLDHDQTAVDDARRRTAQLANVTVRVADIQRCGLDASSVDRVHTDRVLQHVCDPAAVVHDVARMLRPGGRVGFVEPDWDTLVVDHPDRQIVTSYRRFVTDRVVRNASIGRQLRRLVDHAGLDRVRVVPLTATFTDAAEADRALGLRRVTDRAVAAGYLTTDQAADWLRHLATGPFLAAATAFLTVGRRPV